MTPLRSTSFSTFISICAAGLLGSMFAVPADALDLVAHRKMADFRMPEAGESNVRVAGVPAPGSVIADPRCPTVSQVRFSIGQPSFAFVDSGEHPLPCDGWSRKAGRWRFLSKDGAIAKVVLGPRRLAVKARRSGLPPQSGPAGYVQAWLRVGTERYLLRFHEFDRNTRDRIVPRRPARPAALAENKFFATLWGDESDPQGVEDALKRAVAKNPDDGRSQFLLGMLFLYRFGPLVGPELASDAQKADLAMANVHLNRAVELLPNDSRVPGFRASATFANGVLNEDLDLQALGRAQIAAAVDANALFNAFDIFAISPLLEASDPLFQQALELIDTVTANPACFFQTPEVCGNAGMAPHNAEGTFLILGDIAAKGGLGDEARSHYEFARFLSLGSDYAYADLIEERIATVDERVARYVDADPTNDPPFIDADAGNGCAYCHRK